MNVQEGVLLPVPPDVVWDYVQDWARRPEWDRSIVSVEKASDGPLDKGAVLRVVSPPGGRTAFRWTGEYLSYDRPRRSAVQMVASTGFHPFASMAGSWQYEARDGGTRFTMILHYELKWGFVGRLLDAVFLRGKIVSTMRESLENLRSRLARGVPEPVRP